MVTPMTDAVPAQLESLRTTLARASAEQLLQILLAAFESMDHVGRSTVLALASDIAISRRQRLRIARRSSVLAMADAGHDAQAIARAMQLRVRRVHNILASRRPAAIAAHQREEHT
jgi:hypothetical protein